MLGIPKSVTGAQRKPKSNGTFCTMSVVELLGGAFIALGVGTESVGIVGITMGWIGGVWNWHLDTDNRL